MLSKKPNSKFDGRFSLRECFGKLDFASSLGALLLSFVSGVALNAEPMPNTIPSGANVVNGNVNLIQNGNTLNVNAGSLKSIVNYQSFSVGRDAVVNFNLPNANAAILNRVVGGNVSEIFGQINSNGKVFLTNPSGILFGSTAQVNVGSMFVSTLGISDEDFLAGNYRFEGNSSSGKISNFGVIKSAEGGEVVFLASAIENAGKISSEKGSIVFGVGKSIELDIDSGVYASIKIDAGTSSRLEGTLQAIKNSGLLSAPGGSVKLQAYLSDSVYDVLINNTGTVESIGLVNNNGSVELVANSTDGRGLLINNGTVSVSSDFGEGGSIKILGDRLALLEGSEIDASGLTGGGEILIGGDYLGSNPTIQNAKALFVQNGVNISSDAKLLGDGGKIILWSDEFTSFHGNISAQGGVKGGDGGFVEVSSKNNLIANGNIYLTATNGKTGTLLYDPFEIEIRGGIGDGDDDTNPLNFELINDVGSNTPGLIDYLDEGAGAPKVFVIYESEIENTNANIFLRARNSIFTSGTFTHEIAGEGQGVLLIQPDNNLTFHTGNSILDGTGVIDLTGGGASVGLLTIQTQGSGTIEIMTDTDFLHAGSSNINLGALISEGFGPNGAILIASKGGTINLQGGFILSNGLNPGSGIGIYSGGLSGPYSSLDLSGGRILFQGRLETQANDSPINISASGYNGFAGLIQFDGVRMQTFGRNSGINLETTSKAISVTPGNDAISSEGGTIFIDNSRLITNSNQSSINLTANSEAESIFNNSFSDNGGRISLNNSIIRIFGDDSDFMMRADSYSRAMSNLGQEAYSYDGGYLVFSNNFFESTGNSNDFIFSARSDAAGYNISSARSSLGIDLNNSTLTVTGNFTLDASSNADDITDRPGTLSSSGTGGVIYFGGDISVLGNLLIDASSSAQASGSSSGDVQSGDGGQIEFGSAGTSSLTLLGDGTSAQFDVSSGALSFYSGSYNEATSRPGGFIRFNNGSSVNINGQNSSTVFKGSSFAHGEAGGTSSTSASFIFDSNFNINGTDNDLSIQLISSAISVDNFANSASGGSLIINQAIQSISPDSQISIDNSSRSFSTSGVATSSDAGVTQLYSTISQKGDNSTIAINHLSDAQSIFSNASSAGIGSFNNRGILSTSGNNGSINLVFDSVSNANSAFIPGSFSSKAAAGLSGTIDLSDGSISTTGDFSPITIRSRIQANVGNINQLTYNSTSETGFSTGLKVPSTRSGDAISTSGSNSNVLIDMVSYSGIANTSTVGGRGNIVIENIPFNFINVTGPNSSTVINSSVQAFAFTPGGVTIGNLGTSSIGAPTRSTSNGTTSLFFDINTNPGVSASSNGRLDLSSDIAASSDIIFSVSSMDVIGSGTETINTPTLVEFRANDSSINLNNVNSNIINFSGDSLKADVEGSFTALIMTADNSDYQIRNYNQTYLIPSFVPRSDIFLQSDGTIYYQYLVGDYVSLLSSADVILVDTLSEVNPLFEEALTNFGLPAGSYNFDPSGYEAFFKSYLAGQGLSAAVLDMMTYDGFTVALEGLELGGSTGINLGDNTSYARNNLTFRSNDDIITGNIISDGGTTSNILSVWAEQGGDILIKGDVIKAGLGNLEIRTSGFGSYSPGNIDIFGDVVHSTSSGASLSISSNDSQSTFGSSISSLSTGYINVTGDVSSLSSGSSINLQTSSVASTAEASFVSSGQAGNITIGGDITTLGDSSSILIDTQSRAEDYSMFNYIPGAFSNAGNAGDILINGSILSLGQGGSININTGTIARGVDGASVGSAGDITIQGALETFTNSNININASTRADLSFLPGNPTVGSFPIQSGEGGNVNIQGNFVIGQQSSFYAGTNSVAISNGTTALSQRGGNLTFNSPVTSKTTFGSVNFTVDSSSVTSSIEADAYSGNGGNVFFNGGLIAENVNLSINSRSEARGFTEAFSQNGGEITYGVGTNIVNNPGGFLSFYSDSSSYSQSTSFGNSVSGLGGNQTFNGNLVSGGGISFVTSAQALANNGTAQSGQAGNIDISGDLELGSSFSTMNFVSESVSSVQSGNSFSGGGGEIIINGNLNAPSLGAFVSFSTTSRSNTSNGAANASQAGNVSFVVGSSLELGGDNSGVNIYMTSEASGTASAKSSNAGNLDLFGDISLNGDSQNNFFLRAESLGRADSINDITIGRGGDVNIAFGGSLTSKSDNLNGSFNLQSYAFDNLSSSQSYGRGGDIFVNGLMRFEGDNSSFFVQTSNGNFTGSGSIELTQSDSFMNISAQGKSNIIGSFTVDSEGEFGMRVDQGTVLLNAFPDQLDVRLLSVGMNDGNVTISQNADQLRLEVDGPGLTPNFDIVEVDDVLLLPQYFGDGSATIKAGGDIVTSYFIGGVINVSTPGTLSFVSTPEGQLVPGTDFQVDFVFLQDFLSNTLKLDSSLFNLEGFSVSSGTANFTAKNIALDYTTLYAQDRLNLIATDFITANNLIEYPKLIAPDIFIDPIQVGSVKAPIGIYAPTLNNIQIVDLSNQTGLGTTINYTTFVNNIIKDPSNSAFYLYPLLSIPVPPPVPPIPPTPGFFDVSTYELEFSVYDNYDTNLPFLNYSKISQPIGFGTTIILDTPSVVGTMTSASSLSPSEMPYKDANFSLNPSLSLKDVSRQGGTMIYMYEKSNQVSSNDEVTPTPTEAKDGLEVSSEDDNAFVISVEMSERFNQSEDDLSENDSSTQTKKSDLLNSYNLIDP